MCGRRPLVKWGLACTVCRRLPAMSVADWLHTHAHDDLPAASAQRLNECSRCAVQISDIRLAHKRVSHLSDLPARDVEISDLGQGDWHDVELPRPYGEQRC